MIILTTGKEDRGAKATLSFSFAIVAMSMGIDIKIFLTMDGTIWAYKDACKGVRFPMYEDLEKYVNLFYEMGGRVMVSTPCSEYFCGVLDNVELSENAELTEFSEIIKLSDNYNLISM